MERIAENLTRLRLSHMQQRVHEVVQEAQSTNASPDFNLQLDDVIAVGDQVAARWTMRGTQQGEFMGIPPSGHRVTQQGATFYRLVNTRIAEIWFYADSLDMMRQLGVAPVQG